MPSLADYFKTQMKSCDHKIKEYKENIHELSEGRPYELSTRTINSLFSNLSKCNMKEAGLMLAFFEDVMYEMKKAMTEEREKIIFSWRIEGEDSTEFKERKNHRRKNGKILSSHFTSFVVFQSRIISARFRSERNTDCHVYNY